MHKLLDTVALTHDLQTAGLRAGDVGAVVELLGSDAYEVEFVAASGRTQALVTLGAADIRALGDQDLIAVRSLAESAVQPLARAATPRGMPPLAGSGVASSFSAAGQGRHTSQVASAQTLGSAGHAVPSSAESAPVGVSLISHEAAAPRPGALFEESSHTRIKSSSLKQPRA